MLVENLDFRCPDFRLMEPTISNCLKSRLVWISDIYCSKRLILVQPRHSKSKPNKFQVFAQKLDKKFEP